MDRSAGRNPVESVSTDEVSAPDLIDGRMPTIDFFPADVVRHRTARWRGVRAKTMQIINHEPVEYRFKQQYHLLIAVEQGVCDDAQTFIEGLPISTVRNCSHRLMFVPAGRMFFGVLADLVRLRPFHFLRSFKQSFGEPPYRYWTASDRCTMSLANCSNS